MGALHWGHRCQSAAPQCPQNRPAGPVFPHCGQGTATSAMPAAIAADAEAATARSVSSVCSIIPSVSPQTYAFSKPQPPRHAPGARRSLAASSGFSATPKGLPVSGHLGWRAPLAPALRAARALACQAANGASAGNVEASHPRSLTVASRFTLTGRAAKCDLIREPTSRHHGEHHGQLDDADPRMSGIDSQLPDGLAAILASGRALR